MMDTILDNRLSKVYEDLLHLKKIDCMIEQLKEERRAVEISLQKATQVLTKEKNDVERLEKMSVSKVVLTLLGKLQDKTDKEKQEAITAQIAYNNVAKNLAEIEKHIKELYIEKAKYSYAQNEYTTLYEQKLQQLVGKNDEMSVSILEIQRQLAAQHARLKELAEALGAGKEVIKRIEKVLEQLKGAESWGIYDLLGGGLVADIAKHSYLDDAEQMAREVKTSLRLFQTELVDVEIDKNIAFSITSFDRMIDIVFDGFFSDLHMQSKIEETQASYKQLERKIEKICAQLETMKQRTQTEQIQLEKRLADIVTTNS